MATAGAKVIVASKLPHAVQLHVDVEQIIEENTPMGMRKISRWVADPAKTFFVQGTAYPNGQTPEGFRDKPPIVGGFALTYGIDKETWDEWLSQHKTDAMVVNKIIFAAETLDKARGIAKDRKDVRSGLEPVNPEGDRRIAPPLKAISPPTQATAGE